LPARGPENADDLLAAIREARVGGCFWAPSIAGCKILIRAKSAVEVETLHRDLSKTDRTAALWLFPAHLKRHARIEAIVGSDRLIVGDVDPWSVLTGEETLIAHGDDEWVAIATIARCRVQLLSAGRFGAPGADSHALRLCVVEQLSSAQYRDVFTKQTTSIEATIAQLADWRRSLDTNRNIVAACGIAWWKRREIAAFLWSPTHPLRFFRSERRAIAHATRCHGAVVIWPSRISNKMADLARANGVPLVRVEDGFVRSIGLGAHLVPPSSIAVDRLGIHYDPLRQSDLEMLLATAIFPPALIERAKQLRRVILDAGISKYGSDHADDFPSRDPERRLVLVPGQVEDDMSVLMGGGGLSSNLELLRRARALEADAEIWFRPHPDVDAGHRKGAVKDTDALRHADRIVRGGGMAGLLGHVDAVHVLTSLTGFEALLRGCEVICHGTPFYAGWGLTRDLAPVSERRGRLLTLDELVAAVLILYPRYLDPVTGLPCPPEVLIHRMIDGEARNRLAWATRLRKIQGWLINRRE
jgi:capsular polysaccharide export protein